MFLSLLQAETATAPDQAPPAFWEGLTQKATDWIVEFAPSFFGALLVLVIGLWGARILRGVLVKLLGKAHVDPTLKGFLSNILYMALLALVIITALGRLGVPTNSFAAAIAAAGLAVGLALQGSLGNFASGVMLMLFRPFNAGDYVLAGGQEGKVEEVLVFSTRICTADNRVIIVPNGQITGGPITNFSAKPVRRIDLVVGIGYGDDTARAKATIERVLKSEPRVLADPVYEVSVADLAESSVNIVVRPWVKTGDYWPTRCALIERIKIALLADGMTIPFPQRDVHLHQVA